jgi:hypothetical protein
VALPYLKQTAKVDAEDPVKEAAEKAIERIESPRPK